MQNLNFSLYRLLPEYDIFTDSRPLTLALQPDNEFERTP